MTRPLNEHAGPNGPVHLWVARHDVAASTGSGPNLTDQAWWAWIMQFRAAGSWVAAPWPRRLVRSAARRTGLRPGPTPRYASDG